MSFIDAIEINSFRFPLKKPFSNHIRFITHINAIEIRISTRTGIVGHGFVYGLGIISDKEIISYIKEDLIPKIFEMNTHIKDADDLQNNWTEFWVSCKKSTLNQNQLYALTCIDISIWDIFTKTKNISLHQYLGAASAKIPAYGTTGWLSLTQEELIDECKSYLQNGIKAFKVRIGHHDDYSRIKSLRDVIGHELIIMLDANQRYSVEHASKISEKFSQFNILWLEEPTNNLLSNIEKIKKISPIPIAIGENILNERDFEEICKNRLTDYLQPDVPRCGGITGFCRVAKIALKYNIPVCNHLLFELSVSLVAAHSNGFMLEYDNFLPQGIFSHDFLAKKGFVTPPSIPGTGVEVTEEARKKYRIDSCLIKPLERLRCKL